MPPSAPCPGRAPCRALGAPPIPALAGRSVRAAHLDAGAPPKRKVRLVEARAAADLGGGVAAAPRRGAPPPGPLELAGAEDLDPDLFEVLDMASDDELEQAHAILFGASPLSPLGKSLQAGGARGAGRAAAIRRLEGRFRFLAADARATLRGRDAWPTYREALLAAAARLGLPAAAPRALATPDLEAELFLHLLAAHADAVAVDGGGREGAAAAAARAGEGDGMGARAPRRRAARGAALRRLLAPLRLGAGEVLPALAKAGGAVALSAAGRGALRALGSAFVARRAAADAALAAAVAAGRAAGARAAAGGALAAAARFAAARSLLGVVGPVVWASTAADLLALSVGTDHARVARAIFHLAQVRLLRTRGFVAPRSLPPLAGEARAPPPGGEE